MFRPSACLANYLGRTRAKIVTAAIALKISAPQLCVRGLPIRPTRGLRHPAEDDAFSTAWQATEQILPATVQSDGRPRQRACDRQYSARTRRAALLPPRKRKA